MSSLKKEGRHQCGGVLLSKGYSAHGKPKMMSLCISCGYRFREKITYLTLEEVNEFRVQYGYKPLTRLRRRS